MTDFPRRFRLSDGLFALLAFLLAVVIVRTFNGQPYFTDAFYHYNAAGRIAAGEGFVDDYLWTFIGAPDTLPAPSHLYWMPGTSLVASFGMFLFGQSYAAAQIGLTLMLWGAALLAYWLGLKIGGTVRHAWCAGLITLFGGFFMRYWGSSDTFAPYALIGALALALMGNAASSEKPARCWLAAGIFTAFGHLIRSDGLILLAVGWLVLLIDLLPTKRHNPGADRQGRAVMRSWRSLLQHFAIFTCAYLMTMLPWFLRNLNAVGTLLPVGGTQAIWYTGYNDLFSYPPDASPQTFFANGVNLLVDSRLEALFSSNGGALLNFVAIEGMIFLTPLMLLAVWKRRRDPFLRPMIWFAIAIHLAFPLLFPFPGMRGGLFHAIAALLPWWAMFGMVGIDDVVDWMAKRRRHWRGNTGKRLFSAGAVAGVLVLSLSLAWNWRVSAYTLPHYEALKTLLPPDARLMINDPAQLYYYTRHGGVVMPNETPDVIPVIAEKYGVDYVLVEVTESGIAMPEPLIFDLDNPPPFLREVDATEYAVPGTRLYQIIKN